MSHLWSRVRSNKRVRLWLAVAVAVLAVALTAQTVHVLMSQHSAGKHAIDAARNLPLMKPDKPARPVKLAPEKPSPQGDFRPLLGAARSPVASESGPPATTPVAPIDQAVISTDHPALSVNPVSDPSGGTILYCFRVFTSLDGFAGETVDSGCLTTPTWTVPQHVLHDGGKYGWTVLTALSGGTTTTTPQWVNHFRVDQRLGDTKTSPVDEFSGLKVNLYNGNLYTDGGGPTFHSVGGDSGIHLAYNSRAGAPHGVTASYFNDPTHTGTPAAKPVMVRTEPGIDLEQQGLFGSVNNFPGQSVDVALAPAMDPTWYVIRYEGMFQAPMAGDYRFDAAHQDGARVWVNNKLVYDNPNASGVSSGFTTPDAKSAQDITLTAGQQVPVKVELYHHSAGVQPLMVLWVRSATGPDSARTFNLNPQKTASAMFSTASSPVPGGWTLSVAGAKYIKAEQLDGSVVLTDGSGATHTWSQASSGGYVPPVDEDGVLGFDANGSITETEDGVASVFNPDGTLATVTSVEDSKKPAALQYIYSGFPARLTQIKDPVSGNSHTLYYNTDNSNGCYGGASAPSGAVSAPAGMLCRIKYWDGTETRLWYSLAQTLDRIENPGGEDRDFTYTDEDLAIATIKNHPDPVSIAAALNEVGPLLYTRSPLANDWLATQSSFSGLGDRAQITYDQFQDDPSMPMMLRPTSILSPGSDGTTHYGAVQLRDYTYDVTDRKTQVRTYLTTGLNPAARIVTWDAAGRTLTSTDADGMTDTLEWNTKDKPVAATDPTGRRTINIYDHADRVTDKYGPAPATCFNGQLPTDTCAVTIPHTHIGYDEGLAGLQAALYSNPSLSGIPAVWQTGVGTADGSLSGNWGVTPPVANTAGWSGRFTGEIQFPAAGSYQLGFTVVDGVRLWIDDARTIDSWTDKPVTSVKGTYTNTVAGSWHRVRVDYYNRSGTTAALAFTWVPPGGTMVTIPGQNLAPRYGYETSKVGDDTSDPNGGVIPSTKVATGYADPSNGIDPVFGLVTSKVSDPDGVNLIRRNTFEKQGQGFLRQLANALPAGDIADPAKRASTAYYGDTETRANPCDSSSSTVVQAGLPKTVTTATNSDGTANTAETVYDAAGRIVAARINSQPWSCTSYDARGRVTQRSFPAMDGQPGRTVTNNYAVNGDPRITSVSDGVASTITVVDLLGRTVSYTDANGVVTTTQYDQDGRKTADTAAVKGVTSSLNYHWDSASRLTGLDLDGTNVAEPTYNAGILQSVNYGNGTSLSVNRNDAESVTGLTWKTPASTVSDTVDRARDQRIADDTIADSSGGIYKFGYTYDGVGRLIAAAIPHHQLTYSFAADNGCGPNKKAGLNSDRTTFSDSLDGAPAAVTNYCYDMADRLLSTAGASDLSFSYDAYGNVIKVGGDTLGYDSTRRHISTTTAGGASVIYTRDVVDRIIARTAQGTSNSVTRYGYSGDSGGPDFVLDASGNPLQRILKLPGGVVLTKTFGTAPTTNWSYPTIHGDILFTTDGTGTRTGAIHLYDPYGQDINPATGVFADIPIPATAQGGLDFGYLGQHTIPIEHLASQQALEMGARTYLPSLGRFLQTDPVSGGSANNYDYANADPVNGRDFTGGHGNMADPRDLGGGGELDEGGAPIGPVGPAGGFGGYRGGFEGGGDPVVSGGRGAASAPEQPAPAKESPASSFSQSYAGGGGVIADVRNGVMTMAIDKEGGTVSGRQMFEDAMNHFGPQNVEAFDAKWVTQMPTNLDAFNANIRAGMSVQEAAVNTFTGHMCGEYGMTVVTPGPMVGKPGDYTDVEVTFSRPQ